MVSRLPYFGGLESFLRCQTADSMLLANTGISYNRSSVLPRRLITYPRYKWSDGDDSDGEHLAFERNSPKLRLGLDYIWSRIVEAYTSRELSLISDRRQAVRSVTDFIAARFSDADSGKDRYRHGIWRSCAVACLVLQVGSSRPSLRIAGAPSWS